MSAAARIAAVAASVALALSAIPAAEAAPSDLASSLRDQVMRCWSPPPIAFGSGGPRIRVRFALNRDGSLAGAPAAEPGDAATAASRDVRGVEVASRAAIRAVLRCAPYALPAAAYADWKSVAIDFDQRGLGR